MRVKTEARRQAILDVAAEVFSEAGFEGATMTEIATRVGGSKATLYNYFSSKEELFFEVAITSAEEQGVCPFQDALQTTGSLRDVLQALGERLLKVYSAPSILAMFRTVIAESGRSSLGRLFYERGTQKAWQPVETFLGTAIEAGKLRAVDVHQITMHLRALYQAEIYDQLLLGVVKRISAAQATQLITAAVDVFLRAYGTTSDDRQLPA